MSDAKATMPKTIYEIAYLRGGSMSYKQELAYWLAKDAHAGQKYGEHDYFEYHVLGVAGEFSKSCRPDFSCYDWNCVRCGSFHSEQNNNCGDFDEDAYIVALLHDVVEDSHTLLSTIQNLFGSKIHKSVALLTKYDDESYEKYISMLCKYDLAKKVKIADLKFHLSQPVIRNEEKYRKALAYLEGKA